MRTILFLAKCHVQFPFTGCLFALEAAVAANVLDADSPADKSAGDEVAAVAAERVLFTAEYANPAVVLKGGS